MLRPLQDAHRTLDDERRDRLLRRYARERRPADLERLVVAYRGLARRIARRFSTGSASPDDLEQVAYEGLIKAIERFDPERGAAFTSFAVPTMLGELRHYLRDTAWPTHVPRRLQERNRSVRVAATEFMALHGRTPTAMDLAESLGHGVEEILEALELSAAMSVESLDVAGRDEEGAHLVAERIGHEDPGYDHVECLTAIAQTLPALTIAQRQALRLHFGEALTSRQVARRLGITRSQAARDLSSAIATMRQLQAA
jgi:RNA polymerase sigma-B factor